MARMLSEVVYQRLAGGVDEQVLGVLRLDLGCWDLDVSTPEGRKAADIMRRMFRLSWKRLGEELTERLMRPRPYGAGLPIGVVEAQESSD